MKTKKRLIRIAGRMQMLHAELRDLINRKDETMPQADTRTIVELDFAQEMIEKGIYWIRIAEKEL